MNIILAEHHELGASHLPLILVAAVVVIAGIALLAVLFRRPAVIASVESEATQGREPSSSPPPNQTSGTSETPTSGKSKMADPGVFSEILAMLNQKGCPVGQSEIAASQGMTEDEVALALADLEQSGMVQRTWDREKSTYVVEML